MEERGKEGGIETLTRWRRLFRAGIFVGGGCVGRPEVSPGCYEDSLGAAESLLATGERGKNG